MSWKLRWAGHNRGKVRVYREDGSYFYGDPSKYPPQEPQYTFRDYVRYFTCKIYTLYPLITEDKS